MSFYGGGSTSEVGFVAFFGVIVRWMVRRVRRRRRRSVLLSDVIDVRLVVVMRVVGHVEQRLPRDVRTTYGGLQTGVEQRQRGAVQALANALVRERKRKHAAELVMVARNDGGVFESRVDDSPLRKVRVFRRVRCL